MDCYGFEHGWTSEEHGWNTRRQRQISTLSMPHEVVVYVHMYMYVYITHFFTSMVGPI